MNVRQGIAALALVAGAVTVSALEDAATAHPGPGVPHGAEKPGYAVAFERVSGHYVSAPRIVVRGKGCLRAEDSLKLRLVSFEPDRRVVYRCVER